MPRTYRNPRSRRRGIAEIELLLICVVLISVMLLTLGAMRIATARLSTTYQAQYLTVHDATAARDPQYYTDNGGAIVDVSAVVRPGLPNRIHQAEATVTLQTNAGAKLLSPVRIHDSAAMVAPAWTFCAHPVGGDDQSATEDWFMNGVSESHEDLVVPLGLDTPWKP